MKPALRYLVGGFGLVSAAALALYGLWGDPSAQAADAAAGEPVRHVAVVASDLRQSAVQALQLRAEALATDPAFSSYVVQAMEPNAAPGGGIDRASIADLLKSSRHGYDGAMVLDAQGRLVASDGAPLDGAAAVSHSPLVTHTRATAKPSSGAWVHDGQLSWVTVNPLVRGGIAEGLLLTFAHVGADYVDAISRHTGAAVALLVEDKGRYRMAEQRLMPTWAKNALPQLVAGLPPSQVSAPDSHLALPRDHASDVATVVPLSTATGRAVLVALGPASPAPASADWPAVCVWVLGVLAVLWHWWWVERPLQALTDSARAMAHGRHPPEFPLRGSASVRRLARRLNRLLQMSSPPVGSPRRKMPP